MKYVLFHVSTEHSHDFKSVVMLQNCIGSIKDEAHSGSEADSQPCVAAVDSGTEEGDVTVEEADIKVEQSVNIQEENPEGIKFPPIKTEPEVSKGLCVGKQQFMFPSPFAVTKENF
jgi:hypothetical protein